MNKIPLVNYIRVKPYQIRRNKRNGTINYLCFRVRVKITENDDDDLISELTAEEESFLNVCFKPLEDGEYRVKVSNGDEYNGSNVLKNLREYFTGKIYISVKVISVEVVEFGQYNDSVPYILFNSGGMLLKEGHDTCMSTIHASDINKILKTTKCFIKITAHVNRLTKITIENIHKERMFIDKLIKRGKSKVIGTNERGRLIFPECFLRAFEKQGSLARRNGRFNSMAARLQLILRGLRYGTGLTIEAACRLLIRARQHNVPDLEAFLIKWLEERRRQIQCLNGPLGNH